jgi:hypothetical protein
LTTKTQTTKKPTPLSTHALAAFLTWKQFDLLVLLWSEESATTASLSDYLEEIMGYDQRHGGAFYGSAHWQSTYSCLRSLERRQLVTRANAQNGHYEWQLTNRGHKALEWLEEHS